MTRGGRRTRNEVGDYIARHLGAERPRELPSSEKLLDSYIEWLRADCFARIEYNRVRAAVKLQTTSLTVRYPRTR